MFKAIEAGGRGLKPRSGLALPRNCYWNGPFQYNVAGLTYYGRCGYSGWLTRQTEQQQLRNTTIVVYALPFILIFVFFCYSLDFRKYDLVIYL